MSGHTPRWRTIVLAVGMLILGLYLGFAFTEIAHDIIDSLRR